MNMSQLSELKKSRLIEIFEAEAHIQLDRFYREVGVETLRQDLKERITKFKSHLCIFSKLECEDIPSISVHELRASNLEQFRRRIEKISDTVNYLRDAIKTIDDLIVSYDSELFKMNPDMINIVESARQLLKQPDRVEGRRKQDRSEAEPVYSEAKKIEAYDIEEVQTK
jgi:hypothetical protein